MEGEGRDWSVRRALLLPPLQAGTVSYVMVPVLKCPGAVMASVLENVVGLEDVFVFFVMCGSDYCRAVPRLLTTYTTPVIWFSTLLLYVLYISSQATVHQ